MRLGSCLGAHLSQVTDTNKDKKKEKLKLKIIVQQDFSYVHIYIAEKMNAKWNN